MLGPNALNRGRHRSASGNNHRINGALRAAETCSLREEPAVDSSKPHSLEARSSAILVARKQVA
jgi:hypothetical protein